MEKDKSNNNITLSSLIFTSDVGKGELFWTTYTIVYFSTSTEFFFSFVKFPATCFLYVCKYR